MQTDTVDQKLQVLFDRYKDSHYVKNAQQEVEDIRRKANYIGAAASGLAFAANEAIRLTKRSRKFFQFINSILIFSILQT